MSSGEVQRENGNGTPRGPQRHRSPNAPSYNLETCIERARTLYDSYGNPFVAAASIASALGMTIKSSSLQKVIGALNQFGLIVDRGRGDAREIRLSERALDILDPGGDEGRRQRALREAALAPAIHAELWERYEGNLPLGDDPIRYYLTRQRPGGTFNRSSVDQFIEQFRETLAFAGIRSGDTIEAEQPDVEEEETPPAARPKVGDRVQWTSQGQLQFPDPRLLRGVSDDGEWAFVEGTQTGIPMSELSVVEKGGGAAVQIPPAGKTPPVNPFAGQAFLPAGEGTSFTGPLAGGGKWELRLSTEATPKHFKQITKLLKVYETALFSDEDDDDEDDNGK